MGGGRMLKVLALVILAAVVSVPAFAGQDQSQTAVVSATFSIVGIDQTNRVVMLKDKDGYVQSVYAGPEVQRFKELKVGDKVTFRYHESVVYEIQKPGAAAPAADASASVKRAEGKPGGTVSRTLTATVTVQAIDPKIPSVTIKADDGSVSSYKVENPKNLEGVKVGDRVLIRYTQALAVSVE